MTATGAFEEIGYGFIAVDLREQTEEKGHQFGYYLEDELDQDEEELRSLLQEYDEARPQDMLRWWEEIPPHLQRKRN